MRRRSGTVVRRSEPVSTTVVKPRRVSMSVSAAFQLAAESSARHFASVKWTCAFQKPAVTVQPLHATTRAPGGTASPLPRAAIRPSVTTMSIPSRTGASGEA